MNIPQPYTGVSTSSGCEELPLSACNQMSPSFHLSTKNQLAQMQQSVTNSSLYLHLKKSCNNIKFDNFDTHFNASSLCKVEQDNNY